MSQTIKRIKVKGIKEKFLNSTSRNMWFHGLFWLVVLFILVITDRNQYDFHITLLKELLNVLFFALVVYFNILFLIPQYLKEGKIFSYVIFLFFSVLIISPIKTVSFVVMFQGIPFMQQRFIDNQSFIFISSLFVAASSTIFHILSDWQKSDVEMKELEYKTTQSELNFLRSQINPHFLFNTLNNLYALTLKKSDKAPETVLKLSEIMRYMLYECNEKKVLLSKEINYLKNYIELEKLRLSKSFEVKVEIVGECNTQKISPLLLTPFIENAFKHGINQQIQNGYIHVLLYIKSDKIELIIKNSKANLGPSESPKLKSGGIGLENVKRRLEILYPDTHSLEISNTINEYKIILKVKLDL